VVLRNVTLFDGESFLGGPVDVVFEHGIIKSISTLSETTFKIENAQVFDLAGGYVTPGLVDMHSHHLVGSWPGSSVADDLADSPWLGKHYWWRRLHEYVFVPVVFV
jgi:cytosine/adenosine deaminase-related metal-dependent hydrolase